MRQNPAFDTAKKGSKIEEEHSANKQQTCRHHRNDYLKNQLALEGKKKKNLKAMRLQKSAVNFTHSKV